MLRNIALCVECERRTDRRSSVGCTLLEISRARVVDLYRKTCAQRFHQGGEDPLLFVQRCTVSDKGRREGKGTGFDDDEDETL